MLNQAAEPKTEKKEKKFYKPEVFLQPEVLPTAGQYIQFTFNIHPPYKVHVEVTLLLVFLLSLAHL